MLIYPLLLSRFPTHFLRYYPINSYFALKIPARVSLLSLGLYTVSDASCAPLHTCSLISFSASLVHYRTDFIAAPMGAFINLPQTKPPVLVSYTQLMKRSRLSVEAHILFLDGMDYLVWPYCWVKFNLIVGFQISILSVYHRNLLQILRNTNENIENQLVR